MSRDQIWIGKTVVQSFYLFYFILFFVKNHRNGIFFMGGSCINSFFSDWSLFKQLETQNLILKDIALTSNT